MPSSSTIASYTDLKRTLSDDELDEIFAPSRGDSRSTRIRIGGNGWIEKLEEAFRNDEAIALSGLRNDEAVQVRFLFDQYVAQSRVRHLDLDLDLGLDMDLDLVDLKGPTLSDYITAVTHLNLESFSLKVHMGEPIVYDGKGQCLVKLLEGDNLTSLELHGVKLHEIFEGLVEALQSPKCHLSRLGLSPGWPKTVPTRLFHAISSLTSLQRLKLTDWDDGRGAIYLIRQLAAPHCNIWDLELAAMRCSSDICPPLADALQNPDCKLLKLALGLSRPGLSQFRQFCNALQSPHCKLQHLQLTFTQASSFFLRELGNACQAAHKLTSLSLSLGYLKDSECDLLTMFFQSSITRLHLEISTQYNVLLLQALKHPRCRLRHLRICGSDETRKFSVPDQVEIVNFLSRSFACPLESLDIGWETDALRELCSKILNRNKIYRHANQQRVEPSAAKLFVCGASEVGKTTITKNLFRRIGVLGSQRHLSTYGISLHTLSFGSQKLLICDLAGQQEFHAFHHYFVRGSDKDLFLLVCKAPGGDGHEDFENQLRYWLRFIVSHRTVCEHKPRVMVALNYFPTSEKPRTTSMTQDAINRCSTLVQDYSEHINFGSSNDNIFGLVATQIAQVRSIKKQLETNLGELLKSRPKIPKICQDIVNKLSKLNKLVKVISVEDFRVTFGMPYVDEELLKVSLMHLHDIAEVIYFEQETENGSQQLIILDVPWFVRDVVGQFLPRLSRGTAAPNALPAPPSSMAIADVKSRLVSQCGCQEDHIPYILSCLHRLGVLLPVPDILHPASVKVLAFLTDRIENCPWKAPTCTFWGRRFSCKDAARTLLPSGIFAMLQVKLDGKFAGCRIGDGWLHLVEDGIAVMVKVGGVRGDWYDRQWIDVLVRTPFSVDEDLLEKAEALFHKVKDCVFEICGAYSWGCPFIELEEKVIRPEHVENLELTYAEVAPLAQILEEANIRVDLSYTHTWPTSLQGDPVIEIMLPSERIMYFRHKLQDLKAIDNEVHDNLAQLNSSSIPAFQHEEDEHSKSNESKNAVQEIVREVRRSENRIIDEIKRVEMTVLKQMKILRGQGDQILAKLKLHLDFQWPRYPYISNAHNVLQRFSEKVFGGTWKLHLLCEHGSCHHVADQKGITITDWPGWLTDVAPVLVPTLRLLFFLGKVAAIAYVGAAMPLPSPEPLFKTLEQAAFPSLIEEVFGGIDESLKTQDLRRMSPTKDELERFYQRFLNGKDLADDLQKHFGLYHVTSAAYEHAWVCEEHRHNSMYTTRV